MEQLNSEGQGIKQEETMEGMGRSVCMRVRASPLLKAGLPMCKVRLYQTYQKTGGIGLSSTLDVEYCWKLQSYSDRDTDP